MSRTETRVIVSCASTQKPFLHAARCIQREYRLMLNNNQARRLITYVYIDSVKSHKFKFTSENHTLSVYFTNGSTFFYLTSPRPHPSIHVVAQFFCSGCHSTYYRFALFLFIIHAVLPRSLSRPTTAHFTK